MEVKQGIRYDMLKGVAMPLALTYSLLFLLITYLLLDSTGLITQELNELKNKKTIINELNTIEDLIIDSGLYHNNIAASYVYVTEDSITIRKQLWGAFSLISIVPKQYTNYARSLILCSEKDEGSGNILTREDVTIGGKSVIQGNLNSNGRLIQARKEGESYNPDLHEATIHQQAKKSFREIPVFINMYTDRSSFNNSTKNVSRKFSEPTLELTSKEPIVLSDCNLSGNIIISSGQSIRASRNSSLEDIILKANEIIIDDGFTGTIQCIAKKKIVVGQNTKLLFPSALLILGPGKKSISCKKDSEVNGLIAIGQSIKIIDNESNLVKAGAETVHETENAGSDNSEAFISLSQGSIIKGQLYCKGILINEGTINGIYSTHTIASMNNSDVNINHIASGTYDGTVKVFQLTEDFDCTLSSSSNNGSIKRIAKRLYG